MNSSISRTFFVWKILEHAIHLRTIIERITFFNSQHAYLKGKLTETAFHGTISGIKIVEYADDLIIWMYKVVARLILTYGSNIW